MHDVRFSLRLFRKSPGFTFLAVLCLGLGIGVNTSVFSLLNFVLLRPLPVPEPDRLVILSREQRSMLSYPDYQDFRDRSRTLAGVAASNPSESTLEFESNAYSIGTEAVSANFSQVLGIGTYMGRWFTREDEPSAVLSFHAWQKWFASDPNVIGKQVRSEKQWYTIIGVAPRDFAGTYLPLRMDLWVPLEVWARQHPNIQAQLRNREAPRVFVFGRLRPDVEPGQAAAELNVIAAENRGKADASSVSAERMRGFSRQGGRRQAVPVLGLLMAVVSLVLLIACVNVGNLLMARAGARRHEISIRIALGAARGKVMRQLMTESLLLAIAGGVAGLFLGHATTRLLASLLPPMGFAESAWLDASLDGRVAAFTLVLSLLTTLLFGLAPAWRASRTDVSMAIRDAAPGGGRFRLRQATLVAQVGLSLMLLLTAGLFLRSLRSLDTANPGFAVDNRIYATTYISSPEFSPESGRQFYAGAVERLRALPAVRSAGLTYLLPLGPTGTDCAAQARTDKPISVTKGAIDPGFLPTMRIPLVAGRNFTERDTPNAPVVVIVNETLARRLWPDESAIGKQLLVGCGKQTAVEVVGIARDSKMRSIREDPQPHFYLPFAQEYTGLASLIVEASANTPGLADAIRKELLSYHPGVRLFTIQQLRDHVEQSYWEVRWQASMLGLFGMLALLLAAVGLYGVASYLVTTRTREIGVRMAVGARSGDVFRMVVGQNLRLTLVGVALGLALSFAASRLVARFLFGVSPTDPVTYVAASILWLGVTLAACSLPAFRAARVDPVVALRHE